jgi:hypothetical protein
MASATGTPWSISATLASGSRGRRSGSASRTTSGRVKSPSVSVSTTVRELATWPCVDTRRPWVDRRANPASVSRSEPRHCHGHLPMFIFPPMAPKSPASFKCPISSLNGFQAEVSCVHCPDFIPGHTEVVSGAGDCRLSLQVPKPAELPQSPALACILLIVPSGTENFQAALPLTEEGDILCSNCSWDL